MNGWGRERVKTQGKWKREEYEKLKRLECEGEGKGQKLMERRGEKIGEVKGRGKEIRKEKINGRGRRKERRNVNRMQEGKAKEER